MKPASFLACALLVSTLSPTAVRATDCANENPAIPAYTPTSDFTFNPDGTATHHTTGLIWDRCQYGRSQFGPGGEACSLPNPGGEGFVWGDFLVFTKNVLNVTGYKGHTDWRVPNVKELTSIIEYRCWDPPFNTTVFPNMDASGLHSSTPVIASAEDGFPAYTILLGMQDGLRRWDEGHRSWSVLLVRGGPVSSAFNAQYPKWFLRVDKAGGGSGTVTDAEGNCLQLEENGGECLVAPGSNLTLQAIPGPGTVFGGWFEAFGSVPTDCNGSTGNCTVDAMAASGRVTAVFQALEYTLSFDSQGGSAVDPITQEYNSSVSLPAAPARVGHTFLNWNTASDGNGMAYAPASSFTMPASDTILFAIWAINQYSLNYSAAANGSVAGSLSQTVDYGASGTSVMAVADADYHFVAWSDGNTDNPRTDSNVTGDITVTANFAVNSADLQISKSNDRTQVISNHVVVYEILLANAGPYAVDGASFVDTVPDGLIDVSWSCETAGGGATCPSPDGSGNTIDEIVDLPVNGALRYLVTGTVNAGPGEFIDNTATLTIRAPLAEIDSSNNSAQDNDPVVSLATDIFSDDFENSAKAISVPIAAKRLAKL